MNRIANGLFVLTFTAAMTLAVGAQTGTQSGQYPEQSSGTKTRQSAGTASADAQFVKKAAAGGRAEVELGQLAVKNGSSEQVKQFGQRMIDDHGKANEQLKQLASQVHVKLPSEPGQQDRATKERLEKISGAQFDQAYMSEMVTDHKKDVAEFERESKSAKNPAVKDLAQQTLPVLREHLKQAEQIAPNLKAEAGPTGLAR